MKPQQMDLNCELFDDFRAAMDAAIRNVLDRMIEKGLDSGSITGKLDITLRTDVSETTGEVMYLPGQIVSQRWVRGRMAYNIKGDWVGYQLTEVGVNEFVEDVYDSMMELGQEMEGGAGSDAASDDN